MGKSKTGNDEPRLSPRLRPRQLWSMANEPGWRPWMHLIASHPNAWPELTAWADKAQDEGFDLAGMAPKPDVEDSWFARLVAPSTPEPPLPPDEMPPASVSPEPGNEESKEESVGEEALEEAFEDYRDEEDEPIHRAFPVKRLLVGGAAVVLAICLCGGGILLVRNLGEAQADRARRSAISDCAQAAETMKSVKAAYAKLVAGDAKTASAITVEQVRDAKTVEGLAKELESDEPKSVACPAGDVEAVKDVTSKLGEQVEWYTAHEASLGKAVKAVTASKLDKIVDDATLLLADSDGKVADDATRDDLSKAIEAKDERKIAEATAKVNDSIAAKTRADEEAKAQAEAATDAQTQQSPAPSYTPSPSYSSGGTTSGGTVYSAPSAPQSDTNGSSGGSSSSGGDSGWSVPAPAGEDSSLPGSDPGL